MIAWIQRLLWDESAFERYARAALMLLAGLVGTSGGEWIPQWAAAPLMSVAVLIGAGDRNARPETEAKR